MLWAFTGLTAALCTSCTKANVSSEHSLGSMTCAGRTTNHSFSCLAIWGGSGRGRNSSKWTATTALRGWTSPKPSCYKLLTDAETDVDGDADGGATPSNSILRREKRGIRLAFGLRAFRAFRDFGLYWLLGPFGGGGGRLQTFPFCTQDTFALLGLVGTGQSGDVSCIVLSSLCMLLCQGGGVEGRRRSALVWPLDILTLSTALLERSVYVGENPVFRLMPAS